MALFFRIIVFQPALDQLKLELREVFRPPLRGKIGGHAQVGILPQIDHFFFKPAGFHHIYQPLITGVYSRSRTIEMAAAVGTRVVNYRFDRTGVCRDRIHARLRQGWFRQLVTDTGWKKDTDH